MLQQKEIEELREEVILMARKAETILATALQTLKSGDEALGREVLAMDAELDHMELEVDNRCVRILALRDIYAMDFRFVYSVLKTIRDLERVGDESKSVVKWRRKMVGNPDELILALGDRARDALAAAIDALIDRSEAKANEVMEIEFQIDEIEDRIMNSEPNLPAAFIAKALERVGDMATNIAENVIFSVSAEDIRHGGYHKKESGSN